MQITGEWFECDDGIIRPVIHGKILAANNSWEKADFLVDIGADRTVFNSFALSLLNKAEQEIKGQSGGIGGKADAVLVQA